MPTKKFSVIIPSCNEGEWLRRTVLGVLENTDYPDFEMVVVSDGCTDGSTNFLREQHIPNVVLLELPKSLGASGARNAGAHKASGEYLVFIDSHMIPRHTHWLTELASQLKNPSIGAASLSIPHLEEPDRIAYIYSIKDLELEPTWITPDDRQNIQKVPVIPGACFGIRKDVFEQTGGFDAAFHKWGREDLEYSLRLWRLGYDLSFSPRAGIAHSWERKRTFDISWEQVDYNIIRTSLLLFSPAWNEKVIHHVSTNRPESAQKALALLEADTVFQTRKNNFLHTCTRSFEAYLKEFDSLLPFTKNSGEK